MTKRETRVLSLPALFAGVLLATGCFTPEGFGADVAVEGHEGGHGEAEHGEAEHGDHEHGEAEHGDAEHVAAEHEAAVEPVSGEATIEGIVPGTKGKRLDIKVPEITYDAPFDGKALGSKTLDTGVIVENFVVGDGEIVADSAMVEFMFKGYGSATGQQVMASRAGPSKIVINDAPQSDPIAEALAQAVKGTKVGSKIRIKIPAANFEDNAPPQMLTIGDLIMTIEISGTKPIVPLQGIEAYAGEPIATQKLDNGLEIYDYVAGEGPEAKDGDQVVTHYIGQLASDGTEFDSSHGRPDPLTGIANGPGLIKGFSQGLAGARAGMLRKLVVPAEIGYGAADRGKIPPNSALVFFLEIQEVRDGTSQAVEIGPDGKMKPAKPRPGNQPAGDKPAGDKPADKAAKKPADKAADKPAG